jgi:hypothetical protein
MSFDDILGLLRDDLDWPIDVSKLEEASFHYTPEELGIPADRMPSLISIRELQPLTYHQPWGIFFLDFEGPRLPITPLRRLLEKLVASKRAGSITERGTSTNSSSSLRRRGATPSNSIS